MEGLFDDIESWENKKNKGYTIVNILERSSLLEPAICDDEEKGVRMHDLVRDMALIVTQHHPHHFMAKAGLQLETVPAYELWTSDLVKVSLSQNNIEEIPLGMSPETPNLRVLILSKNPLEEIPDSFFVHMKALEVLNLSYVDIKRLPDTVSDLVNLRALLLQGCCELSYVPSVAKLTKLMTLYLPKTACLPPEGMERLKCLQKLSYCHWRLSDLPRFNSFIQSCQLYSYSIWLYDIRDEALFDEYDDSYESDESDDLDENKVTISGAKFGETEITLVLPCNIKTLYVHKCRMEGQRSLGEVLPSLRDAKSLRWLVISYCVGLKYVSSAPRCVSSVSSYLDNLEYLELIDLPDLRSIGENGSFSSFSHLKKLKIEGCVEVEEIFESNREFLYAQRNLNPSVALPELLYLELEDLPKLRNIYSIQLHLCTSLQEINISDCAKLEGIVMSPTCDGDTTPIPCFRFLSVLYLNGLPLLSSIYQMRLHRATSLCSILIIDCPKLEGIFASCTADTKSILTLPTLRSLILRTLPNLSSVYRGLLMSPYLLSSSLNVECPKLKVLSLSYQLICDASQSTLASLPTESESPEWWQPLHQNFPNDVIRLSDYILQARQSLLLHDDDDHDDDNTNRVSWLTLSTS